MKKNTGWTHFYEKKPVNFLRVMKLLFVLMTVTSLSISAKTFSQYRVTLDVRNVGVMELFKEIQKKTNLYFVYNVEDLQQFQNLSVTAKNESVETVLQRVFGDKTLEFVYEGEVIIVKPKAETATPQQRNEVMGKVMDKFGTPLPGVSVLIKGTTLGVATDVNGLFKLELPKMENMILVFSFMGMESQEVRYTGQKDLKIYMQEATAEIDEVVVVGYGTTRKKDLTGSVVSVKTAEIKDVPFMSVDDALAGKAAGVAVVKADGSPGGAVRIRIRGGASLLGTNDPLYVIDGVQSDAGQFNNIDFNDIESISVLKDASAAIYGVRAANGVVVVNTKKGKRNTKNTVSLNAYYGWQNPSTFPKPADAATYITNYIQSETVQGKTDYTYSKEDYQKWLAGKEKGYVPFDWYDFIWETNPQYYLNANISGGSDKTNYYVSVGHMSQDAMIVNYGGFKRTNVQMNIDTQITSRLKVGASMNGRIEERKNPGVPEADDYWMPRFGTYRNLPTKRPFANDNPKYPTLTSSNAATNFGWLNYELSGEYKETWRVAQLQATAEYDIFDGLKAKALVGYYLAYQQMNNQEYTYKLYGYDEATDTYPVIFENNNPWRERRVGHNEELMSNIQLSYNKRFGDHNVAAVAGVESIKRDTPTSWLHAIPTANALHLIDYETMDTYNDEGNETEARLGWMFRGNYDYANKYLVEFSARYDGSWKFPPDHRWGFFPSASVGWRISEENFWKESKLSNIFSDLKIRGSYGMVGDDNVSGYAAFDYMSGYNYKNGGSVIDGKYTIGSVPRGLPVTTLSWIKAKILDVGFDVAFLDNRLTGQFDFFRRQRDGLPASRYDVLLPSEVGFSLPKENLNSDVHMGYDAAVRWTDRVEDFTYSIGGNITYSRFYDWEQYKPRFSNSWDVYRNSLNHRFGYLNWGLEAIGQFNSWEEIATYPIDNDRQGNKTLRPGDIKYKDVNGDGVINSLDERPIGYREDSTPILNFGLNFSFGWKGFDLAFDFTGGAMGSWYQQWEQRNPFHDGGNNPQYYMEDTWRLSDIWDADSELIPGKYPMLLIGNSSHSNYWNSTFWKKNVRYVKLRNLELGYTLPKHIVEKALISDLRFYVAGTNLLTFTNAPGIDPESTEGNGLGYPTTRIINIGVNLKF